MNLNATYLLVILVLIGMKGEHPEQPNHWTEWIKENAQSIELSNTDNFDDLKFLNGILQGKRIVFLGENSHGVSEFNALKSRIVHYLHQELDFDVIAFESNAGDAFAVDLEHPYKHPKTALYNSVSSLWHVAENISLFERINQSKLSADTLFVAGIDITQSNGSYAFSRFLKSLINPIDSVYAEHVRIGDSLFSALGVRKWTMGLTGNKLITYDSLKSSQLKQYQDLLHFIEVHNQVLDAPKKHIAAANFYLESRIHFIHQSNRDSAYMADFLEVAPERNKKLEWLYQQFRERLQAENLIFLAHHLYPDKKIIVWAQNTHIEKINRNRMPFRLSQTDSVYTIGLFNYRGQGCFSFGQGFNGTSPEDMIYDYVPPIDSTRIEKILASSGHKITFVDMKYQTKNSGNSWMFDQAKYAEWDGTKVNEITNVRSKWDALLLVEEITPPDYVKFDYDYLMDD